MSQRSDCIARVRTAVDRAVPYIEEWKRARSRWLKNGDSNVFAHTVGNSEMSTRYILIDPILRALGWDLSDPQQCVMEYNLGVGKPDYLLFGRGDQAAIIEAKRIDKGPRDYWEQVYHYGKHDPPDVACITNGKDWSFCVLKDGEYVFEDLLSLICHNRDETANRLCDLLGHAA